MPTFAIFRSSSVLCSCDTESAISSPGSRALVRENVLILEEAEKLSFVLESRYDQSPSETWVRVFIDNVYILPSKIGEDSYQSMSNDLEEVSRSLLIDLYGKSKQTHDLRYAKEGHKYHSRDHE